MVGFPLKYLDLTRHHRQRKDRAIELINKGIKNWQIVERLGLTDAQVSVLRSQINKEAGTYAKRKSKKPQVVKMLKSGMGVCQVAEELGLSKGYVSSVKNGRKK